MKTLLFLIFSASFAYGEESKNLNADEEGTKVIIHALDENVNLKSLDKKNFDSRYGLPKEDRSRRLPGPDTLHDLFKKAGLSRDVASYDQLDKDLLFRKVKKYDLKKLKKNYPKIEVEKLKKLKGLIGNE